MTPSESAQRLPDPIFTTKPPAKIGWRRTVTTSQVANAITQLREQRGLSAAMQIRAVLRALDLTVVPDPDGNHSGLRPAMLELERVAA